MKFSTILIVLTLILAAYYAGMILYDLYFHKQGNDTPAPSEEKEVDISKATEGFDSIPVGAEPKTDAKGKETPKFISPVEAEVLRNLMERVDLGEEVDELQDVAKQLNAA